MLYTITARLQWKGETAHMLILTSFDKNVRTFFNRVELRICELGQKLLYFIFGQMTFVFALEKRKKLNTNSSSAKYIFEWSRKANQLANIFIAFLWIPAHRAWVSLFIFWLANSICKMLNWTILVNAVRLLFLLIPMMYDALYYLLPTHILSQLKSSVHENKKTAVLLRFLNGQ